MIASVELLRIRLRTTNSKVVRRTDLASWDFRLIPISLTKTWAITLLCGIISNVTL